MRGLPDVFKRLESRISLALSKAQRALQGVASLANNVSAVNAAPIGPSGTVTWSSASFTPKSRRVLVMGTMSLTGAGGTMVAGDAVLADLLRDGVGIPTAQATWVVAAGTGAIVAATATWIDSVVANTAHVWSISAVIGGGHTATSLTGEATITLIELPAAA